jgi:hypothetical protein
MRSPKTLEAPAAPAPPEAWPEPGTDDRRERPLVDPAVQKLHEQLCPRSDCWWG